MSTKSSKIIFNPSPKLPWYRQIPAMQWAILFVLLADLVVHLVRR
jgi:hypothetical protein